MLFAVSAICGAVSGLIVSGVLMNENCTDAALSEAMRCHQAGNLEQAEQHYLAVLKLQPDHPAALNNLGALYLDQGRPVKAASVLEAALRNRPNYPTAQNNMGLALRALGRIEDSIEYYRDAVAGRPDYVDALGNLGLALQAIGEYQEAESVYLRALDVDPEHPLSIAGRAELMEWEGRYQEAAQLLESAGASSAAPEPFILLVYARVQRRLGNPRPVADQLADLLSKGVLSRVRQQQFHFTLGDLYDDLAEYDKAFMHYAAGNEAKQLGFNKDSHSLYIDAIIESFDANAMSSLPRSEHESEQPVFIVGMPRSGTTLIEQILSQHPDVHAAGERSDIGVFAAKFSTFPPKFVPYPAGISGKTKNDLVDLAMAYLGRTREAAKDVARITDKMPVNFLHIGFIELIFPHARIVHCYRDARDVALSCYFQDFIDPALAFASSLNNIASYYNDYRRLMEHWKRCSGLPRFDLRYEELVASPGTVVESLLAFLELEWHDSCLDFYKTDRVTQTASHAQVRQPIYDRSVGRYRNYEKHVNGLHDLMMEK